MMELNTGLETGIVATGLVCMLGMAVWLFFRSDSIVEKSLYLEMMSPHDDEIDKHLSVPLLLPSLSEGSSKDLITAPDQGFEVLNQKMRVIPFDQQKEAPMESPCASSIELQDRENTGQIEPFRPSSERLWQKSAGMFSGRRSSGGILVVEDDPHVRKLTRLILEDSGYDVLEAKDGEEAINLLSSGENPMVVDTIITDLNMPNIDGFEAIAYFQKEFPSIPIIVLTGIDDLEVARSFMRQGVSNYLVKPVGVKQLTTSVAEAIAQRQLSWA